MSEKQVFTIEIQSVKPHYTGVIKDSVSGESATFNSAGQQINFIVKHAQPNTSAAGTESN